MACPSSLSMEPGTEIDLSDKAAWDDTALIEAYDRAISTYQEVHGSTPELLSVLRTKHCSRTAGSTPSKNLAHNLDEEGEEDCNGAIKPPCPLDPCGQCSSSSRSNIAHDVIEMVLCKSFH